MSVVMTYDLSWRLHVLKPLLLHCFALQLLEAILLFGVGLYGEDHGESCF